MEPHQTTTAILRLRQRGLSIGAIAVRAGVSSSHVRTVLAGGAQTDKPAYVKTTEPKPKLTPEQRLAAKRARAEAKRAKALQRLAEANAELG